MSTTDFATIRANQLTLIEALTPTSRANETFRRHRGEAEFVAWIEENPQAATRYVEIIDNNDAIDPLVSNTDVVDEEQSETVLIAYPLDFGLYSDGNYRGLQDLVAEDKRKIDQEIGLHGAAYGKYVAGQHLTELENAELVRLPHVAVLALDYRLIFRRQAN